MAVPWKVSIWIAKMVWLALAGWVSSCLIVADDIASSLRSGDIDSCPKVRLHSRKRVGRVLYSYASDRSSRFESFAFCISCFSVYEKEMKSKCKVKKTGQALKILLKVPNLAMASR
ncbi:hypothetical protein AKJ16_DCAP08480 [Drosera capensis]